MYSESGSLRDSVVSPGLGVVTARSADRPGNARAALL
jgi:hypothetical protein